MVPLTAMNLWKAILALLLLATWLPCEVKGILFPALDCCSAEHSQHGEKTDCEHCQICGTVLTSGYNVSEVRIVAPEIFAPIVQVEVKPEALLLNSSFPTKSDVPPDILTSWQFDLRAALPVRAPSFAS
jgi:hypothetical protein